MNLYELTIKIQSRRLDLNITPFYWYLGLRKFTVDRGDFNNHKFYSLCFELDLQILNKRGKEGREYRKNLRKGLVN